MKQQFFKYRYFTNPRYVVRNFATSSKMKVFFFFLCSFISFKCIAQDCEPEFGIYFGNDFKFDSVSILVNGITIAKNIQLRSTAISPTNLIIIQDKSGLYVRPHWDKRKVLKRIPIKNSTLILSIQMNNSWQGFKFDLKKGKYLFAEYTYFKIGWSIHKILIITQEMQGPILM